MRVARRDGPAGLQLVEHKRQQVWGHHILVEPHPVYHTSERPFSAGARTAPALRA